MFAANPFAILLCNQIQIYFRIWLKISVKIKILLVGNAPFSLVNLYAQVTKKCPNMLLIRINGFSVSDLHGGPRKSNRPFGIYENIRLGLVNYALLGLIEHHGVFIDSGHYVSYIRQSNKWYHCDDRHITGTNLLTLSNGVCLVFYAKEVDLGT